MPMLMVQQGLMLHHAASGSIGGLIFELDAAQYAPGQGFAGAGCAITSWSDLATTGLSATLNDFNTCGTYGWQGDGSTSDPYRLQLDGSNDYAFVAADSRLTGFAEMTITFWIKLVSLGASWPVIVAKGDDVNREYLVYTSSTGQLSVEVYNPTMTRLTVDGVMTANNWRHVAMTFKSGSTVKLFVNGAEVGSASVPAGPIRDIAKGLAFGRVGESANYFVNGAIAHAAIYSRELTPTEVLDSCNALKARFSGTTCS